MEIWKDIVGYEEIYEVSSYGRIRTVEGKKTYTQLHGTRIWKQRVLKYKGYTPQTGYRVSFYKNGEQKDFLVSRLVAFTFYNEDINNRKLTVNHKDGNRMNNMIENLELISLADNIRHGFETGLYKCQKQTKIKNLMTGEILVFRNQVIASRFFNKNVGFINGRIKKRKLMIDDTYEIIIN